MLNVIAEIKIKIFIQVVAKAKCNFFLNLSTKIK